MHKAGNDREPKDIHGRNFYAHVTLYAQFMVACAVFEYEKEVINKT
jgi:hypothetical protein